MLCRATDHFTDRDKGLVTGLGFLVLFATALFTGLKVKSLTTLIKLVIATIVLFLVSSFVIGPLIGISGNSMILYAIINSFFVAIVFTTVLHKIVGIAFRKATMIATMLCLLLAYLIDGALSPVLDLNFEFDPILTLFNIFQLFLIIPLTLGMTIKPKVTAHEEAASPQNV